MFIQTSQIPTLPKKKLLPKLNNMSQILTKTMSKHMKFYKLRVIFKTSNALKNYFCFKDFAPETLQSSLIYKFLGEGTVSYMGKTYRQFKVKFSEEQVN